jgi:uncharacterized glyoxalase superfamily protein PhnB
MAKAKRTKKVSRKAAKPAAKKAAVTRARAKAAPKKGTSFTSAAVYTTVDDVSASLAWYCDVLGFTVKERWEQDGTLSGAELLAGDVLVYVMQDDWKKGRDRVKGEGMRVFFYVKSPKDVDRLADGIKKRGGAIASGPADAYGMRAMDLVDPSGFKITITSEQ